MTTPKKTTAKKKLTKPPMQTHEEHMDDLITSIELHDIEQSHYLHECVSLAIWLAMGSFVISMGIAITILFRSF